MKAFVVVGLGFGDEGKGATVDYLARTHKVPLVVRFSGGPQAAHNVVTPDGRHHEFAQFGSASFVPGTFTHLSRYMLVNPLNMAREEDHLRQVGIIGAFDRLTVDEDCIVVTPFHRALNRLREWSRGAKAHGSCGQGVGQARSDFIECGDKVLLAGDLRDGKLAKEKLMFLQRRAQTFAMELALGPAPEGFQFSGQPEFALLFDDKMADWCLREYSKVPLKIVAGDYLKLLVERHRSVIFEGAQGVMLDETHGTAPHNTWTDTTCNNANTLLKELGYDGDVRRIGVLRTYYTRHGAGPFETEDWTLAAYLTERHNNGSGFQGNFRLGHFDSHLAKYALNVSGGVDELAITHVDAFDRLKYIKIRVNDPSHINSFKYETYATADFGPEDFLARIEKLLARRVTIMSDGPTAENRVEQEVGKAVMAS